MRRDNSTRTINGSSRNERTCIARAADSRSQPSNFLEGSSSKTFEWRNVFLDTPMHVYRQPARSQCSASLFRFCPLSADPKRANHLPTVCAASSRRNSSFAAIPADADNTLNAVAIPVLIGIVCGLLMLASSFARCKPCQSVDDEDGPELPCGLTEDEVFDLLNRDLTPEDYELLLRLDSGDVDVDGDTETRTRASSSDSLKSVSSVCESDIIGGECVVCLCPIESGTNVVALRCQYQFHENCISLWLSETGRACPLCRAGIDY